MWRAGWNAAKTTGPRTAPPAQRCRGQQIQRLMRVRCGGGKAGEDDGAAASPSLCGVQFLCVEHFIKETVGTFYSGYFSMHCGFRLAQGESLYHAAPSLLHGTGHLPSQVTLLWLWAYLSAQAGHILTSCLLATHIGVAGRVPGDHAGLGKRRAPSPRSSAPT